LAQRCHDQYLYGILVRDLGDGFDGVTGFRACCPGLDQGRRGWPMKLKTETAALDPSLFA
jgi:hypothetical protein